MEYNKKILYSIIAVLIISGVFVFGLFIGNKTAYYVPQPDDIDFSLFWDAYYKLSDNFIDPLKIDKQKIIYGAIEGMVRSLEDPYTNFFRPEEAKILEEDLSGSFEGIGAEIGIRKDRLTIISPLEGAPAQKSGLESGDIVLEIDGQETSNMSIEKAVTLIRGKKGSTVVLNIFREDWDSPKDISILRDTIKVHTAKWSLKDEKVAYIQIFQFDRALSSDFQKIAPEIKKSSAKKIILDLRNNPGGYLDIAQDIAGWFLEKDKIVTIEDEGVGKEQTIYKTNGNSQLLNYPVVVLINEGSASASEILAGALRDNRGIKLVGKKSFGKGSIQTVLDLYGGSMLKITIAKWLTPAGHLIAEVGLTPDIEVNLTEEDKNNNRDPQLEKALEIAQQIQ